MCTRGISCRPVRKKKKPIKWIQSLVQLYIRQQSIHMTRKSGQTVGNDQRGWPWKWAVYSFYTMKDEEEREEEKRRRRMRTTSSKIPSFFRNALLRRATLNMFLTLYVQVLFFLIFFSHSFSFALPPVLFVITLWRQLNIITSPLVTSNWE